MKFAELVSIGHNISASVSDGVSFLFRRYELDVYGDAQASPEGRVTIDFLTGNILQGKASETLREAMAEAPSVLANLCSKHGAAASDFATLRTTFGVDQVYGSHFTVVVEDQFGRRSDELYAGSSGRRLRRALKAKAQ